MKNIYIIISAIFFLVKATNAQYFDLELHEPSPSKYITPGTYAFKVSVANKGASTIQTLRYNYSLDNGPVVSSVVSSYEVYNGSNIFPNARTRFTTPVPVTFPTTGTYTLKAWCDNFNGVYPDQNHANDTVSMLIKVLPYVPQKNVMIDYYTHTLCGPCGDQGDPWVQTMLDSFPNNAFKLGIHRASTDPFTTIQSIELDDNMGVYAHPTIYFDRFKFPYFEDLEATTSYQYFYPYKPVRDRIEYTEAVEISVAAIQYNSATRVLQFDVNATFYDDYNQDLALNAYIVEDSLFYYQAGAPSPNNYYHRYVFRESLGPVFGVPGSLPPAITSGSTHTQSFLYTVPLNFNINQLYIYGLIQSPGSTYLTRPVLNMKSVRLTDFITSIADVAGNNSFNVFPSPATDKIFVTMKNPDEEMIRIFNAAGAEVFSMHSNGDLYHEIDISHLSQGIYTVLAGNNIPKRFIKTE